LDIVVFAPRAGSVSEMSAKSRAIFAAAAERGLHLAVADLPVNFFDSLAPSVRRDRETLTCLRSVLMKPEHLDWIDRIWQILASAADASQTTKSASRSLGQP
jgi:tyrosine decarboxylase/aspartate 1-decarboxylase